MSRPESPVEIVARHVAEAERRVARQKEVLERLVRICPDERLIAEAQSTLHTLETSLRLAHEHLERERKRHGSPGSGA
jgi:hypothetical protein